MSLLSDVEQLKKVALPEIRRSIADKVSTYYCSRICDGADKEISEGIIRLLAKDTDASVRQILARNLAECTRIPHDIIRQLAWDIKEVSILLVKNSIVLTDDDLVLLVKATKENTLLMAIAMRQKVTSQLVSALVNTHVREVVVSVLINKGADVSDTNYQDILDFFYADAQLLSLVMDRGNLSHEVIKKLFGLLQEPLRARLCTMYKLDSKTLMGDAQYVERSVHHLHAITVDVASADTSPEKEWFQSRVTQYVGYLYRHGQLTASTLLRALYEGNICFFERAIARLAALPIDPVCSILAKSESDEFMILLQKANIPPSLHESIGILLSFALMQQRNKIENFEDLQATVEYKKQLIEYISSSGYDQTVALMPYIKAVICTHLEKESLMAAWGGSIEYAQLMHG